LRQVRRHISGGHFLHCQELCVNLKASPKRTNNSGYGCKDNGNLAAAQATNVKAEAAFIKRYLGFFFFFICIGHQQSPATWRH
jgi:hypothetical protein